MKKSLKQRISIIPGGEWFHGDDEFQKLGRRLSKKFSEEEVLDILRTAYRAVANEYGD